MKNYTYYLSSYTLQTNSYLNGYLFVDPITNQSTTYPVTATGGTNFGISSSYSLTATDGLFFPYAASVNVYRINDILPNLKGDYTISFVASAIQSPFQIIYNFGDGVTNTVIQSFNISNNLGSINTFLYGLNAISPKYQIINHTYYAPLSNTTIYPTITVVNPDLTYTVYTLSFLQAPNSVYDINNTHIIESTQQISSSANSLNVIEVVPYNMTANLLVDSQNSLRYPYPYLLSAS